MAHTITSYYVSEDVAAGGSPLSSWSVYSEQYMPEALDEGDPIDGSQRVVSTHPTEDEARAEADRLWKEKAE